MVANWTTVALSLLILGLALTMIAALLRICAVEKLAYYAGALSCESFSAGLFLFRNIVYEGRPGSYPQWLLDWLGVLTVIGWGLLVGAIVSGYVALSVYRTRDLFD